jgi:hypothetical protein
VTAVDIVNKDDEARARGITQRRCGFTEFAFEAITKAKFTGEIDSGKATTNEKGLRKMNLS